MVRNGLQWKDAPRAYGPHKTLYNHFVRWSRLGVFANIFAALAAEPGEPDRLMIDATHLESEILDRCRERVLAVVCGPPAPPAPPLRQ